MDVAGESRVGTEGSNSLLTSFVKGLMKTFTLVFTEKELKAISHAIETNRLEAEEGCKADFWYDTPHKSVETKIKEVGYAV